LCGLLPSSHVRGQFRQKWFQLNYWWLAAAAAAAPTAVVAAAAVKFEAVQTLL
jgi:hypothetical protein